MPNYNGFPLMVKYDKLFALCVEEFNDMMDMPYSESRTCLGKMKDGTEFHLVVTREADDFMDEDSNKKIITFAG